MCHNIFTCVRVKSRPVQTPHGCLIKPPVSYMPHCADHVSLEGKVEAEVRARLQPYLRPELHLMPYQVAGAHWLENANPEGRGAILGDDMGLGKTITSLSAALLMCPPDGSSGRVLFVANTRTVMQQWVREIKRFTTIPPDCVLEWYGMARLHTPEEHWQRCRYVLTTLGTLMADYQGRRVSRRMPASRLYPTCPAPEPVLVAVADPLDDMDDPPVTPVPVRSLQAMCTSIATTLVHPWEAQAKMGASVARAMGEMDPRWSARWRAVFVDEADLLRVEGRPTYDVDQVKKVCYRAVHNLETARLLLLTGTPVNNDKYGLRSLLGLVGGAFVFGAPQVDQGSRAHIPYHRACTRIVNRLKKQEDYRRMHREELRDLVDQEVLSRVCLRRVAGDPRVIAQVSHCIIPETVMETVSVLMDPWESKHMARLESECGDALEAMFHAAPGEQFTHMQNVMRRMMKCRRACLSMHGLWDVPRDLKTSKERRLLQLVRGTDVPVVVVTQFHESVDRLYTLLTGAGLTVVRYSGAQTQLARCRAIQDFSEGAARVLVMTLQAGGRGLNLGGAGMLVLYGPWFNVATETQAVNRVRRLGGAYERVRVVRMCQLHSIESFLVERTLRVKREMAARTLGEVDVYGGAEFVQSCTGATRAQVMRLERDMKGRERRELMSYLAQCEKLRCHTRDQPEGATHCAPSKQTPDA